MLLLLAPLISIFDSISLNILLATQHFKAAAEAYQTHDHLSAQQHSLAGRENLRVAQEQNQKAAEEIFKFNNRKNKIWRVDLHGLHGSEAVQALQSRLNELELDKIDITISRKLNSLEVITGVGKHSRGKPVLPTIIRSFLNQKKYQFEDVRPGALKVWLQSSSSQAIRSR
ncbi:smr domain-containing protein C11H11.03c-like [Trifolium pratense]|uniref:smr domain-containing protein C11H11.03c-like n=1 Tax=Trifolium pratense TaxID=57577 RepID=UPI001E695524|nr:smr domain-containing protein C11H11.03c-like [Trifolium pratense]